MCAGGDGTHAFYEHAPGAATAPPPPPGFGYRQRESSHSVLFQLVNDELATFRASAYERGEGTGLPAFVWRDLERFLTCGDVEVGFMRARCKVCRRDILVGFSCHSRGVCPSCGARRMHDTAFHLVDRVLPQAPFRHWVLSYPKRLRPLLARMPRVADRALGLMLAAIFRLQRQQARERGLDDVATGAIAFLHRGGDSLNLNPHVHTLVPDGVFTRVEGELVDRAVFHPLPQLKEKDVLAVAQRVVRQTRKALTALGLEEQAAAPDALDGLFQESLAGLGPRTEEPEHRSRLSAFVEGFSLQAATRVHQNDRQGLESLCRYGAKPPIVASRLKKLEDGNYSYQLRYPLPAGKTELRLSGQKMMARLALLVPRPGKHLVRYKGVFASNSSFRRLIVPKSPRGRACRHGGGDDTSPETNRAPSAATDAALPARQGLSLDDLAPFEPDKAPLPRTRYLDWASLLRRVYGPAALLCDRCGSPLKVIAFIEDRKIVRRILDHLGIRSTAPPQAPARSRPQPELFD